MAGSGEGGTENEPEIIEEPLDEIINDILSDTSDDIPPDVSTETGKVEEDEQVETVTEDTSEESEEINEVVTKTFEATAYVSDCIGCTGITKTGVDVRNTEYFEGRRVIATDPSQIPLGSTVEVTYADGTSFEATAQDIGSAIQGNRIDILVATEEEAISFGRQDVEVRILD